MITRKARITIGSVAILCAVVLLAGCGSGTSGMPSTKVPATDSQGVPDYASSSNWLSLPSAKESAKKVDVFFLYPTAYQQSSPSDPIVCAIDNPQMQSGAKSAFQRDATVFSTVGNIYAPWYRQAAISVLALPFDEQQAIVGGEPTSDCISAFDYYIKNLNKGRPFILASHSQGSNIMVNLLAGYMKQNPDVYKRMVVAYVIGYSITPDYLRQNPELKFATGPDDTGVIVSYNTEAPTIKGKNPVVLPGAMVINPITWTTSEREATAAQNLGSISVNPQTGYPVTDSKGNPEKVLNFADAKIDKSRNCLICSSVDQSTLAPGNEMVESGIYHSFDYPFYYFDLRANARNRVARYLKGN